jgi:hypothetical protein
MTTKTLSFHGIAQRKKNGFKAYVAPDYMQVLAEVRNRMFRASSTRSTHC